VALTRSSADPSLTAMIQAKDLVAFNAAAEQSGRPWRVSRLDPRGWQLVHVAGETVLEMPDARTGFEAVKRAVAFLLSEGSL
jgi:hypothetical protein